MLSGAQAAQGDPLPLKLVKFNNVDTLSGERSGSRGTGGEEVLGEGLGEGLGGEGLGKGLWGGGRRA